MTELDPSVARILIKSLQRGTTVSGGAKHFHCGHEKWLEAQLEELAEIEEDGGAVVHFVRGAYGEGKSHFLNYLEDLSRDRGWATSHVECRQDKIEIDRFESVYPKIVQKLRLAPDSFSKGDDMPEEPARRLLDSWAERALKEAGYVKQYVMKPFEAEIKLFETLQTRVMRINLNGDFQRVLSSYPRAAMRDDYSAMSDLAGWLRGEDRDIHIPSTCFRSPDKGYMPPGSTSGSSGLLLSGVSPQPLSLKCSEVCCGCSSSAVTKGCCFPWMRLSR
jgi:BREX system ATP-binding protein BrxC/D